MLHLHESPLQPSSHPTDAEVASSLPQRMGDVSLASPEVRDAEELLAAEQLLASCSSPQPSSPLGYQDCFME